MSAFGSGTMGFFNVGYIVCLILTVLFFILSIILFFVFDIRHIFMIRSGKAAKRDIKKMEKEKFKTGNLEQNNKKKSLYGESGDFETSEDLAETEVISNEESTTVLEQNETTVLNNIGETTVLYFEDSNSTIPKQKFNIIKKQIYIHTKEVI